ncbi:hypothetical protein N0V88_005488 [Collariella sp. IMI 366227]|nr:hypothetical protein N0V88_005488 [Collariella sp. IMI 366227]
MAPLVPRMHVFEIDDFSWFPDFLRAYIQAGLTAAWTTYVRPTPIFELQDRGVAGFLSCCLFGAAVFIMAPYYAWLWGAPLALFFTYVIPIVPVVLVFDGWMSCLRTRTPDEVEALLRTCGAAGGEREIAKWEIKSGSETFMWPVGNVNWIIAVKKE